jgi:ER-bound oxygenase mpaB/B'/Rubber oxygenase, catalytic domain
MLGGARALLMHSAHPLVVAGARQTGMYANQPWRRLERTLRQTYTVVFETRRRWPPPKRIDDVHRGIKGVDPVTGLRYDARDPELLLWVHACLVDSFVLFERLTVGRLDDADRQALHEESMVSAAQLRLPRERIPPTVPALRLPERGHVLGHPSHDRRGPPGRRAVRQPAQGRAAAAAVGADLVPGLPDPPRAGAPPLRHGRLAPGGPLRLPGRGGRPLAERLQTVADVEGRSVSDVLREAVARLIEERRRDERFLRLLEENVARHQRLLQALRDQGPGA